MLTQERLKEVLKYDHESGVFTWASHCGPVVPTVTAGCINTKGYIVIGLFSKIHKAHRLAWLYVHGYFPENEIDHIDRDKTNNKISNLREVSRSCNSQNSGNQKNNTSGVRGVCWRKQENKWNSKIMSNGEKYHLGNYDDLIEAVCARLAGEQSLGWSGCNSSSPAYEYVKKNIKP